MEGDIPAGWTWDLLAQAGKNLNIIHLTDQDGCLSVKLTAEMLALSGYYVLQLRGTQGEMVRHTNVIRSFVPESLSGDARWPEVPSEFSQLEQRVQGLAKDAQDAVEQAENARDKYPKIINGNWHVYDPATGSYVDTGVYAGGDAPYIGENGNWFVGSVDTGVRAQGEPGAPGKTPERGVDYWTEADKQEIVSEVLEQVPSGSEIDDTAVSSEKTWSSKNIVEKLAPAFESSGPVVTCNPVEGYPLHVVSQIVSTQAGEGDPSPANVRPISGWDSATLTHNDTTITSQFGQTVYGGTLDWTTGALTINKIVVLVNSETLISCSGVGRYSENLTNFYINLRDVLENSTSVLGENAVSNQFKLKTSEHQYRTANIFFIGATGTVNAYIGFNIENTLVGIDAGDSNDVAVQKLKLYLSTNPFSFCVVVDDPQTIHLTPTEILALSGTNTIYTETGGTTVSGRADPNAIIQQLAARIAALEGSVTNL